MRWSIKYDSKNMCLEIHIGSYDKYLQCPFMTWWRARKYFKRPRIEFFFGPMWKNRGKRNTQWGEIDDYEYRGGYWPAASTEFLRWNRPKWSRWIPIHIFSDDICWKDKWNTPRFERPGYFMIIFGNNYHTHWQLSFLFKAPKFFCGNDCTHISNDDCYWESMLWYLYYGEDYNKENDNKKDLIKARDTMQGNWVTTRNIKINDFKITGHNDVGLFLRTSEDHHECSMKYVDVVSEELCKYTFNMDLNCEHEILMIGHKDKKLKLFRSSFIKTIDEDNNTTRLFFREDRYIKNELDDVIDNIDDCDIEFAIVVNIDLGPSWKDEFMTKRAIKEIKDHYNNSKK